MTVKYTEIFDFDNESLGIREVKVVATGHPDYHRGFIIDKKGVTIGRMTIYEGELDHIKWYKDKLSGPNIEICTSDLIKLRFHYFLNTGKYLNPYDVNQIVEIATKRAESDWDAKIQKRSELPTHRPDGSRYKRKRLDRVSPRQRLNVALSEFMERNGRSSQNS